MVQLGRQPEAIVFDLDDTLYRESDYVRSGFLAVAGRLAGGQCDAGGIAEKMWRAFEAGPRDRVFNTILRELGLGDDGQVIAELVGVYRCHRPRLQLAGPVGELLGRLKERYRLGIITDGYLPAQKLKIEALGVSKFFEHIVYTEELGRAYWKPSPRAFELMAEALGCAAERCVYVADNATKDFIAPNALGWQTIQVKCPQGVHTDEGPPEGRAQYVLGDVLELGAMLLA